MAKKCKTRVNSRDVFYYGISKLGYKQYQSTKDLKSKIEDDIKDAPKFREDIHEYSRGKVIPGTTTWIKDAIKQTDDFSDREQLKIAIKQYVKSESELYDYKVYQGVRLSDEVKKSNNEILTKVAKAYKRGDNNIIVKSIDKFKKRLNTKGKESSGFGTLIHNYIEHYYIEREKLAEKENNGSRIITLKQSAEIKDRVIKKMNIKSDSQKKMILILLDGVEKETNKLVSKYDIIKIEPEQIMDNNLLGVHDDGSRGMAGTADMVFYTSDGGFIIFDNKTKERYRKEVSEEDAKKGIKGEAIKHPFWNNKGPNVGNYKGKGFTNLAANKYNEVSIQSSIYGLMLEAKGYKMLEARVMYIDSDVDFDTDTQSYVYTDPRVVPEMSQTLIDLREPLKRLMDPDGKIFDKHERKEGVVSDINSTMEHLMGGRKFRGTDIDKMVERKVKIAKSLGWVHTESDWFSDNKAYILQKNNNDKEFKIPIDFDKKNDDVYIKQVLRDRAESEVRFEDNKVNRYIDYMHGTVELTDEEEFSTIKRLFTGVDISSHSIKKISDYPGMADVDLPIIITEHKITGEMTLNYISNGNNGNSSKVNVGDGRHTVFGMLMDNIGVDSLVVRNALLVNDVENFKALSLSILTLRMKQMNPKAKIVRSQMTTSLTTSQKIRVIDADVSVELMKRLRMAYKENLFKAPVEGYIKEMFEDDTLFVKKNYKNDTVSGLLGMINADTNMRFHKIIEKRSGKTFEEYKKELANLLEDDSYLSKGIYNPDLISKLESMRDGFESLRDFDEMKDVTYIAITRALGYMYKLEEVVDEKFDYISTDFTLQSNNANVSMQRLSAVFNGQENKARAKIAPYKNKMDKIMKRLMKQHGYSNTNTVTQQSLIKIFTSMMQNPEMDRNNKSTMMKLKSADAKGLTAAERDFITLYNEKLLDAMSSQMTAADFKENKADLIGWIPWYRKTNETSKADKTFQKMSWQEKVAGKRVSELANDAQIEFKYEVKPQLLSKWNNKAALMGYDPLTGEQLENWEGVKNTEINLEYILNNVIYDDIQNVMHSKTINVARVAMLLRKMNPDAYGGEENVKAYMKQMETFIIQTVLGGSQSHDIFTEMLRTTSKVATMGALISTRQILLDSSTILFNGISRSLANMLENFGRDRNNDMTNISSKSYLGAVKLGASQPKLFNAIGYIYGLQDPDSDEIKNKSKMKSMKGNLTDKAFAINKWVLDVGKTTFFIARMIEDGSIHAYSLDKEGGLVYDVKKDKRFYRGGKLINKELLDAVKLEAMKDEDQFGLNEDGTLSRGYTVNETNVLNAEVISFTGSFDKGGKTVLSNTAIGQGLLKFKSFLVAKVGTYYRPSSSHEEEYYGEMKKILAPDGKVLRYEWVNYRREGILQTLSNVTKKLLSAQRTMLIRDLSPIEKKNLSRLTSDLAVAGVMFASMSIVFEPGEDDDKDAWIYKSAMASTIRKALVNASMDVFFAGGLYDVTLSDDAALFAGVNVTRGIVSKMYDLMLLAFPGNESEGFWKETKSLTGVNRSSYEIYETWHWDEYKK